MADIYYFNIQLIRCCNICPRDSCPRRHLSKEQLSKGQLSKETLVQGDISPRRQLSKETLVQVRLWSKETITCILVQGRNIARIKLKKCFGLKKSFVSRILEQKNLATKKIGFFFNQSVYILSY